MQDIVTRLIRLHKNFIEEKLGDITMDSNQYLELNLNIALNYLTSVIYGTKTGIEASLREAGRENDKVDIDRLISQISNDLKDNLNKMDLMHGEKDDDAKTH